MKDGVEIVRILEALDSMRSFRGAAKVAGCDHHTVKRHVPYREAPALYGRLMRDRSGVMGAVLGW